MTALRILGPDEIRSHLDIKALIGPMEEAFRAISEGRAQAPVYVLHPNELADIHVKSAAMMGCPIFTVKMAGWSQVLADRGEPSSSGMIAVFDAETCRPMAILQDNHLISDYRTAAAGALIANTLARENATSAAIIGAGVQARLQAQAVCHARAIEMLHVWGRNHERCVVLKKHLQRDLPNVTIKIAETAEAAVRMSDIVIVATTAKAPIIEADWLSPGQHLTSVGSDDSMKCEVSPAALARADLIVVDEKSSARNYGNIHRGLSEQQLGRESELVEIGAILNRKHVGRTSPADLTIASLVGLGVQDLAAVNALYHKLL